MNSVTARKVKPNILAAPWWWTAVQVIRATLSTIPKKNLKKSMRKKKSHRFLISPVYNSFY